MRIGGFIEGQMTPGQMELATLIHAHTRATPLMAGHKHLK